MKVWIVVQHYDRGSDEVCVEGAFSTEAAAQAYIDEKFPGWEFLDDDVRPGYYSDFEDPEMSDYLILEEVELK